MVVRPLESYPVEVMFYIMRTLIRHPEGAKMSGRVSYITDTGGRIYVCTTRTSNIDIVQNKDGPLLFTNLFLGFVTVFIENLQYTNVQIQMYPVGTLTSST